MDFVILSPLADELLPDEAIYLSDEDPIRSTSHEFQFDIQPQSVARVNEARIYK
jgi:hypothetical protein